MFCKKDDLKNFTKFTGKYLCWKAYNFIKKETPRQVLSYKFGKIFKNTFLYRTPLVSASVYKVTDLKHLTKYTG